MTNIEKHIDVILTGDVVLKLAFIYEEETGKTPNYSMLKKWLFEKCDK